MEAAGDVAERNAPGADDVDHHVGEILTDAAAGFQQALDRRIDRRAARPLLETWMPSERRFADLHRQAAAAVVFRTTSHDVPGRSAPSLRIILQAGDEARRPRGRPIDSPEPID